MVKTAFLGLGVMGFHMAGHLAAKGHQLLNIIFMNQTPIIDWKVQQKISISSDGFIIGPNQSRECFDLVIFPRMIVPTGPNRSIYLCRKPMGTIFMARA